MTNIPAQRSSAVHVDEALTFARRRGDVVELTLELPHPPTVSATTELVLRKPKLALRVPVTTSESARGLLLHASVPASGLQAGTWKVLLEGVAESDGAVSLQARLVVDPRLPVALLTGPRPSSVHAPPAPRSPQGRTSGLRRAAVSAVDTALSPLSPERAARYRGRLKDAVRKVRKIRRS